MNYHFKQLNSTNTKAKDYEPGSVITADIQTRGKGRLDRKWSSNLGGAWFSIVVEAAEGLTFLAAISVRRAIKNIGLSCKVKWPNDIFAGKKLAGILTQCTFGSTNKCVIGIGINVNNDLPKDLEATSLKLLGFKVDKDELIKEVVIQFQKAQKEPFKNIIAEWKQNSMYLNKNIQVETLNKTFKGKFIDIATDCSMMLRTEDNEMVKIVEGTVRPL